MGKITLWTTGLGISVVTLFSQNAGAWGHRGHQTVAEVGVNLSTVGHDFWNANIKSMAIFTNSPDVTWKVGPNAQFEKPNHWFQPDSYSADPREALIFPRLYKDASQKYGVQTLTTNGTAPWRVKQFYDAAVVAARKGDYVTALQLAGVMSHYVGDMSQPLHVTKNYDGQETGDPGIHKFFETDNLEATDAVQLESDVTTRAQALLKDSTFRSHFNGNVVDAIFEEIQRSYTFKDQVLNNDKTLGRTGQGPAAQLDLAKDRLADGAATLAIILDQMWTDAGNPRNGSTLTVSVPAWIPPSFDATLPPKRLKQKIGAKAVIEALDALAEQDDCDR